MTDPKYNVGDRVVADPPDADDGAGFVIVSRQFRPVQGHPSQPIASGEWWYFGPLGVEYSGPGSRESLLSPAPAGFRVEKTVFEKWWEGNKPEGNDDAVECYREVALAAWNAAIEESLTIYEKAFEQNWVVQDTIDAIRRLK